MGPVKFTEKQAALWMEIGEGIYDMYVRGTDLSLPNDVAVDPAWMLRTIRRLKTLADRLEKTFPRVRRNTQNAAKRKERSRQMMELLPSLMAEIMEGKVTITNNGESYSADRPDVSDSEPN